MSIFNKEFNTNINWLTTGDTYNVKSISDYEISANGKDSKGNDYVGGAVISKCNIVEVVDVELV